MQILFITASRIGDAIISTSVLNHLLQTHPNAEITVACGPLAAPLFQEMPQLKQVFVLNHRGKILHWVDLWKHSAKQKWDLVVDLRGSTLAYLLRAKDRKVWRSTQSKSHRVEQLAELLQLAVPSAPCLWVGKDHLKYAESMVPDSNTIAIAPIANWRGKEWPLENFMALAKDLTNLQGPFPNAKIAIITAPHERPQALPMLEALGEQAIDLTQEDDLLRHAACLKRCRFFIGNDSGLMHMAAAIGTPTLGLFGPSRHEHYAPWQQHLIRTPETYEELTQGIDFSTTGTLMTSLSVKDVYKKVLLILQEAA